MPVSSLSTHTTEYATKATYEFSKITQSTTAALKNVLDYKHETRSVNCEMCPEPELDLDMDRQEATFAAIGHLWATIANNNIPAAVLAEDGR